VGQNLEQNPMSTSHATVRDLRRLWKPHKQRLSEINPEHPTNIRFHRSCSWMQRGEQVDDQKDLDLSLLSYWVAFNTLYGQWDDGLQEPVPDRICWRHFLDRMLDLDSGQIIGDCLMTNRPLVMSIFDDQYLSHYFWKDPTDQRARQSKKAKFDAQTWYLEGNWTLILDCLIDRIYLLRCQLVHGAATYNSSLNRIAIRRCSQMMNHLLRAFLLVWIERGSEEDWGIMCYPPIGRVPAEPRSGPIRVSSAP